MKTLLVTLRAEKRVKSGQLWIYSNEVLSNKTPLSQFEAGEEAELKSESGRLLGYVLINPKALICARLVSARSPLSKKLIKHRLNEALSLRAARFTRPFYRAFYAEGDFLPGLVIDRFDTVCVVQITLEGLIPWQDVIANTLLGQPGIEGVVFRSDTLSRQQEGMSLSDDILTVGDVPEMLLVEENGCRFEVPVGKGQKTGWFYDHRDNRAAIAAFAKNARVLDVFSYLGGWGFACLKQGAAELVSVDSSKEAIALQASSAALNGFESTLNTIQMDAFKALDQLLAEKERFDIVILDPPAFIKKRKDQKAGEHAYKKINEAGIRLLNPGGFLVAASCSMHLGSDTLQMIVQGRARHNDRRARLCYKGGHPVDHPVHPAMKETEYLKAQIYQITR